MSEFLGTASVLIRPDTTGFRAALEAAVLKASKGVVVPIPVGVVAKATKTSKAAAVATTENAVAETELAAAAGLAAAQQEALAINTKLNAAAQRKAAADARLYAKRIDQVGRGALTATASQAGLRGAVLASSAPFLAAVVGIETLAKSMHEASTEAEALAAVSRVLGEEGAKTSEVWARSLAPSFGLSAAAALRSEAGFANLFRVQGAGVKQAETYSKTLVQLTADLSAFRAVSATAISKALQLGIAGNIRGFKTLGIVTSSAEIAQEALRETGKKSADDLSRLELATARYNIILLQTTAAQGAFAARAGDLAGQSAILRANLANLGSDIGNKLVPTLNDAALLVNKLAAGYKFLRDRLPKQDLKETAKATEDAGRSTNIFVRALQDNASAFRLLLGPGEAFHRVLVNLGIAEDKTGASTRTFSSDLFSFVGSLSAAANAMERLQGAADALDFRKANAQISALEDDLNNLIIAGQATPAATLAILQAQEAAAIDALGKAKGGPAIRAARQHAADIAQQIQAIQDQQAADAAAAASAAKSAGDAAKSAADARKKAADQAFLAAQEFARGQAELAIARAANTKALGDDIRAELAERNLILKQIAAIRKSNLAQGLKKLAIQALTLTLVGVNGAIKDLNAQKAANRKAAKDAQEQKRKDRQDALLESLQLDIDFAQTTGNVAKEERAHRALIRELRKRLRNKHLSIVERKRLRNAIAEEEKAIKELTAAEKKKNNAAASLQFEFLQAQQGFAANLLSNILPASAFGGTVGGVSGATGGGLPISSFQGGREDPTRGLGGAAAVAQASQRTASQSQASVMIVLLRQIVAALTAQKRGAGHPEARYQRSAGSSNMDIL